MITSRTSHRMPSTAQSGRVERVRVEVMISAVFGVGKGDIVTSPRG